MRNSVKTIADIASLAGVSKSTVSRALNDSPLISHETKTKIREIADAHRFKAHQGARNLSLQRSQTIALIIPVMPHAAHFITDPFFVELLGGIAPTIAEYGYDLLIGQPRVNDINDVGRYIDSKRADGLIFIGCQNDLNALSELFEQYTPIILFGETEHQRCCTVNCDNLTGGRLAVRHLIQIGRKRIAFLGGQEGEPEVLLRYRGYTDALQEAGYPIDPAYIAYGDYSSCSGYENMRLLLTQAPQLDAVFICSDLMAIGALEALREEGKRVPEDMAVVGYDDIPLAAYCSPPLTTIRQNIIKTGRILVHNLMQYLQDHIITRTILPVELIVRKSSVASSVR